MNMQIKDYVNWKMSHDVKYGEAEGYPLVVENCRKNKNLKDYKIYGNSVQDGEPTPENPIEIKSVGEFTTKNLYYPSVDTITVNGITATRNSDNTFTVNGTAIATAYLHIGAVSVESETTYYVSGGTPTVHLAYQLYQDSTGFETIKSKGDVRTISNSFTNYVLNKIKVVICVEKGISVNDIIVKPMISLEETDEYEPYQKYKIPITIRGKNYFNLAKVPFNTSTTQPYKNGLKATKMSDTNRGAKIPITLPVGKKIMVTMDVVDSQIGGTVTRVTMGFYNKGGTLVRSTNVTSTKAKKSYTFTLSEEISYIQFYFQSNNSQNAVGDYVTMDNIMLRCEGDDSYESYIEPQITNIFLDEPLRKVGDYTDEIDFKNCTIIRRCCEKVFDGQESIQDRLMTNAYVYVLSNKLAGQGISTHFKYKTSLPSTDSRFWGEFGISSLDISGIGFFILNSTFVTSDEFKLYLQEQYLNDTPVKVYYAFATSIIEDVKLPSLLQFKGTTIYEVVDTEVQPSNMYAKYIKK